MSRPCVFFDRDGIVNVPPSDEERYVLHVSKFFLQPEFVEALKTVRAKGFEAVLVTNQKGVGIGRMSAADLDAIHDRLVGHLRSHGLALTDIYVCTAADDSAPDRKPNPGMLLRAAEKHGLDLASSWMIGDKEKDAITGERAGCRTVLVRSAPPVRSRPTVHVPDMKSLVAFLASEAFPDA